MISPWLRSQTVLSQSHRWVILLRSYCLMLNRPVQWCMAEIIGTGIAVRHPISESSLDVLYAYFVLLLLLSRGESWYTSLSYRRYRYNCGSLYILKPPFSLLITEIAEPPIGRLQCWLASGRATPQNLPRTQGQPLPLVNLMTYMLSVPEHEVSKCCTFGFQNWGSAADLKECSKLWSDLFGEAILQGTYALISFHCTWDKHVYDCALTKVNKELITRDGSHQFIASVYTQQRHTLNQQ